MRLDANSSRSDLPLTIALALSGAVLPALSLADLTIRNAQDAAPPALVSGEFVRVTSPVELVDVLTEVRSFRGPMPSTITAEWKFEDQHGRPILAPVSEFPQLATGDVIAVETVLSQNPFLIFRSDSASEVRTGRIIRPGNPNSVSE